VVDEVANQTNEDDSQERNSFALAAARHSSHHLNRDRTANVFERLHREQTIASQAKMKEHAHHPPLITAQPSPTGTAMSNPRIMPSPQMGGVDVFSKSSASSSPPRLGEQQIGTPSSFSPPRPIENPIGTSSHSRHHELTFEKDVEVSKESNGMATVANEVAVIPRHLNIASGDEQDAEDASNAVISPFKEDESEVKLHHDSAEPGVNDSTNNDIAEAHDGEYKTSPSSQTAQTTSMTDSEQPGHPMKEERSLVDAPRLSSGNAVVSKENAIHISAGDSTASPRDESSRPMTPCNCLKMIRIT
jgi:hypothetical protein